ncbi:hypothetical protein RhiTH_010197 [Rhizoctonia solani]
MIDRFIYLYQPISRYIALTPALTQHLISHKDSELLSSKKTPTLAFTLLIYHALIQRWKTLRSQMPALSHAIDAGIAKLEDYVEKSRSLPAHALAMALNPSIRYFWIEKYWSSEEALKAKELVQEHLLQCLEEQEARRQNATQSTMVTVAHTASQAANGNLTRGHEAFLVNEAFLEQKVIPPEKLKGMTAIEFWKASWVSSERVFSLIRMTCTQSRNRILAGKVESLQILKHSLRRRPDVPLTVYTRTLNLMARHLDGALGDGAISTVPIDTE